MTGGSRGIGATIALTLARNGADVAISYERAADRAQDIVDQIDRDGHRGIAIQANSADPDADERLVEHAVRDLGGLDTLINNAGTIRHGDLVDLSPDDISTLLHVHPRNRSSVEPTPSGSHRDLVGCPAAGLPVATGTDVCPQFERSSVTGGEEHDPVVVLGVVQHLAVERE
ncbi:SDR family NAD(P)-dependent oxidoreductase [Streptomyces sp. ID03-2B]|uniref:SDR family NAD(P)-dependent oxidoreductase n=1 Tax=Streptomyces caviscabies TaxID=90079 RepID=A0ABW2MBY5_9ACTN|nr:MULTISPECIES: SDR family NAD(P)-dependent oxidoreductase [unclassified Streptomyces]MCL6289128.1 SDR family NAD(P)-dependent oxidoreductase [Streptomyces sp. 43Y-GA-1]MDX3339052.1 SDR family NAD(P)-dependent oxidoreductase [Streptomyces sp. ME02-6979.5a]MDX3506419.1 SDR family NAD(P)-dependent oxidoreductase [Streptomyces sp. ATCC51928]MDX3589896.1 SDR family NAD(P)-dependent oxidoreductase [Streptomyces sp. ID03-2B]MDX5522266.1 SDR family NAD(P)-dependent oxidoreductase [Streptomyces sp. D